MYQNLKRTCRAVKNARAERLFLLIKPIVLRRWCCRRRRSCLSSLKPTTHLAILYADRGDRRKSPGVPGAAIAIFADIDIAEIADIWHVRYPRLNSLAFARCARSRDFLRLSLRIASKVNQSGWAILFTWTMLRCHIAAIGEKNRQVCPVARRSNSPRSAYKIARCVAGLKAWLN